MLTLEELKVKIAANYDECALVDRLGLTTTDLVERFEDVVLGLEHLFKAQANVVGSKIRRK